MAPEHMATVAAGALALTEMLMERKQLPDRDDVGDLIVEASLGT